jgi:2,3-bisphosphoglycerate-independent phosphoglycerate mutase
MLKECGHDLMPKPKPLVLIVLDGWGYALPSNANAISLARTPNYAKLLAEYPNTLIDTSGRSVGLPDRQIGNSEVGHLNIGAGRVVRMDNTRIDLMIENGELFRLPVLLEAMAQAKTAGRRLHFCGLLSNGGHSHQNHLYALLKMAKQNGVERTFVHCFMDGRDSSPESGAGFIGQLQQKMREYGIGTIATVSGRYFAMDRNGKWDRGKKVFDAMVHGIAETTYADPVRGIKDSYVSGVTDEFVIPFVCTGARGEPVGTIRHEDVVINFNFRADRARQITRCLARESGITADGGRDLPDAIALDKVIPRNEVPKSLQYICMTEYDVKFNLPVVVPSARLTNILANVMANHRLRNLRVAETEKYAHVTFFFNGGVEKPFLGEERVLVPSPKVATYDLQPEMSAKGVADAVVKAIDGKMFDVVIVNFANADMVGHSGKISPTIRAVEVVDDCLGEIYSAIKRCGSIMLVTADHGNAEQMIDPQTGGPHTAHTANPVPFIYIAEDAKRFLLRGDGALQDIAPTMLGAMGIPQPKDMTGRDLRISIYSSLPNSLRCT